MRVGNKGIGIMGLWIISIVSLVSIVIMQNIINKSIDKLELKSSKATVIVSEVNEILSNKSTDTLNFQDSNYKYEDITNQLIEYSVGEYSEEISEALGLELSNLNNSIKFGDKEIDKEIERVKEIRRQQEEIKRKQNIINEMKRRGNIGRLRIPSIGVDVALFNSSEQSVCDAKDSAAYFSIAGQKLIGDHRTQSFRPLRNIQIGSKVYIDKGETVESYRVVDKFLGINDGYDLLYRDRSGSALNKYSNSICLYTCDGPGGIKIIMVYIVKE